MCSTIDSGEKGYKLSEQILFNFLVLFATLKRSGVMMPGSRKLSKVGEGGGGVSRITESRDFFFFWGGRGWN